MLAFEFLQEARLKFFSWHILPTRTRTRTIFIYHSGSLDFRPLSRQLLQIISHVSDRTRRLSGSDIMLNGQTIN